MPRGGGSSYPPSQSGSYNMCFRVLNQWRCDQAQAHQLLPGVTDAFFALKPVMSIRRFVPG